MGLEREWELELVSFCRRWGNGNLYRKENNCGRKEIRSWGEERNQERRIRSGGGGALIRNHSGTKGKIMEVSLKMVSDRDHHSTFHSTCRTLLLDSLTKSNTHNSKKGSK